MINNQYMSFIQENFPKASSKKDERLVVTYKRIQEANIYIEIIEKYSQLSHANTGLLFSNRFQINLNKLLLYLPLNDEVGINIIMRTVIESLLKYFYIVTTKCSFEKANNTSFRNIKDELNVMKSSKYFSENILNKLFSLYSAYSNDVHLKTTQANMECQFLQEIISGKLYNIDNVNRDLTSIIDAYNSFNIVYFNLKETNLTVAERLKLRLISNKRKKRFLSKLLN